MFSKNRINLEPGKPVAGWRRWLFRVIVIIIIPLAILLLVELGLRIAGYGFSSSIATRCDLHGKDALCDNYKFTWRFFPRTIARAPDPFVFLAKKPTKTYRIFVLGGSAAQGVPDGAFNFGRILQVMLQEFYPEYNFELINTAITAINSHVVHEIVKDCAHYEGDLFIVYMGNNEVVGPYGVGTIFSPHFSSLFLIRSSIFFKSTKLGQLVSNVINSIIFSDNDQKTWRGLEMFLEKQIRANDPNLGKIYGHFRKNLEDIAIIANKNEADIIFCTVACNLKDNPPFGSLHRPDLTVKEKRKWERIYSQGIELEKNGKYKEAVTLYLEVAEIDNHYADLMFRLGRCYWELGEFIEAKDHFIQARELDTLRFRVDNNINQIIRETARKLSTKNVFLTDAAKFFEQNSPHRVPGNEFFYEHVHLKFSGNYLLAKAIFKKMEKILHERIKKNRNSYVPTMKRCARHLAYTDWDRFNLAYEVLNNYIKKPPYSTQLYHEERVQRLEKELKALSIHLAPESLENSAVLYRKAISNRPYDWWLYAKYARLLSMDIKNLQGAMQQYHKVKEYLPHSYYGYAGLGLILQQEGRSEEAVMMNLEALRINPFKFDIHNNLGITYQHLGKINKAIKHFSCAKELQPFYVPAYMNLALLLSQEGKKDEAIELLQNGIQFVPNSPDLHYNLGIFFKNKGILDKSINEFRIALKLDPNSVKIRKALNNALRIKAKF